MTLATNSRLVITFKYKSTPFLHLHGLFPPTTSHSTCTATLLIQLPQSTHDIQTPYKRLIEILTDFIHTVALKSCHPQTSSSSRTMSERYTPRYFSQQGASSTGNDFLENRPSNAEYGVAFDPGFGDAELIDEQDTWSNNNTILPTLDELTYGYSQTQYGLPSGGSQSRSGLESSIQWNGILPNAGPPITSHAEGFETWQAPESSYGNAAPSIPYHGIPQQHGTYQDWFPYDNGQLNDGSYIPAAFSTQVSETQREPYVNSQHTVSQQYNPYQADFSHNDGMFQNVFITHGDGTGTYVQSYGHSAARIL